MHDRVFAHLTGTRGCSLNNKLNFSSPLRVLPGLRVGYYGQLVIYAYCTDYYLLHPVRYSVKVRGRSGIVVAPWGSTPLNPANGAQRVPTSPGTRLQFPAGMDVPNKWASWLGAAAC